ncbi:hypothetical protein [Pedobacter caeni]|nr:hypothetical protein [Pedobacter caeni]
MKKACLFILFPIFILNASFIEVFKMPKLVSHFLRHHELDERIGVLDFLAMHYFGQDIDDDDQKEDMELPFKKLECPTIIHLAIPAGKITIQKASSFLIPNHKWSLHKYLHANPEPGDFFKPPRA